MRISEAATAVLNPTPTGRETCEWQMSIIRGRISFLIAKNSKQNPRASLQEDVKDSR